MGDKMKKKGKDKIVASEDNREVKSVYESLGLIMIKKRINKGAKKNGEKGNKGTFIVEEAKEGQ